MAKSFNSIMKRPKKLYYITHIDNVKSIVEHGILCHQKADGGFINGWLRKRNGRKNIYDKDIIAIRKEKQFNNQSLWDYANVYFQARNPMLYRVTKEFGAENISVLEIDPNIIDISGAGVTDGNAAVLETQFFKDINEGLSALDQNLFDKGYWIGIDGGKRRIMAEVLIPDCIPKEYIKAIYTHDLETSASLKESLKKVLSNIAVIPQPWLFFLPKLEVKVSKKITLIQEDMFFSKLQTFTVSVNTMGVMGKGLASRAKYQFPDVYVKYQDLCRNKKLKMGQPFLYKREEDFEKILAEDTGKPITENGRKWFLLFPTKNHWRNPSPVEGIKQGLEWLLNNYKIQGIESIALPALGCGLGGLAWKDIGPLMCKYLNQMDIPSCIYLPLEQQIPEEQLKPDFLI